MKIMKLWNFIVYVNAIKNGEITDLKSVIETSCDLKQNYNSFKNFDCSLTKWKVNATNNNWKRN